jgi:methylglutaconyl-CoA hydratase
MNNSILVDISDRVATVTLNKPEVHNAFDEDMIAALSTTFDDLAVRSDVVAVVLRGAGKSFSAGADANWMKHAAGYTEIQNKDDAMKLAGMLNKLYTLPKPVVACVQGAAMGGGFGLVSCCDIVLAAKDATFALSEVKLGLIPATIAPYVRRAIGERQFRRYGVTGEKFGAERAQDIGLAHEVVDDLTAALSSLLVTLRANGPQAMAATKRLIHDLQARPIDLALMSETAGRIAKVRAADEAKEGLSAFLEKRKAAWQ